MIKRKRIASRYGGISALVLALAMRFFFALYPGAFEAVYFQHAFPFIRKIQSWIDFLWVIPGYYILAFSLVGWLIWRWPKKSGLKKFAIRIANLISGMAASFLFLFGMMYLDRGYANRYDLENPPEQVNLVSHYTATMTRAMSARSSIPFANDTLDITMINEFPTEKIKKWVSDVLIEYPAGDIDIDLVKFKPAGILRRLGISGIYNPFTGEANIDAALPSIQMVYVAAHEMAHAHGITSEAEANFVAYLACLESGDPIAVYAAEYMLWRQIAQEINKTYPRELLDDLVKTIPQKLIQDRQALIAVYYAHKAYFPAVTHTLNNTYLKVQGIEAGADDYDGFLKIYLAWNQKIDSE